MRQGLEHPGDNSDFPFHNLVRKVRLRHQKDPSQPIGGFDVRTIKCIKYQGGNSQNLLSKFLKQDFCNFKVLLRSSYP